MMPDPKPLVIFACTGVGGGIGAVLGFLCMGVAFLAAGIVSAVPIAIGAFAGLGLGFIVGRIATKD